MYISYSGYKLYDSCPRAYWHRYVNKTPSKPDNRVHMLYGETVGIIFEKFYSEQVWKHEDATDRLLALVDDVMASVVKKELGRGGILDWEEKNLKPGNRSIDEVRQEVRETIPRGIDSIRRHRLLGVESEAEVKLDSNIQSHRLGGRADFLLRRAKPDGDKVLIDGKGSRWRDKYVDRRQLKWYAMLHEAQFGALPDRLGFLYWRSEPEDSLDWVACTPKDVEILKGVVLDSLREIDQGKLAVVGDPQKLQVIFPVKPAKDCKLCSYLEICDEGTSFLRKKVPLPEGIGVEDVGLG